MQGLELGLSNPVSATGEGKKIFLPGVLCETPSEWGRNLVMSPPTTTGNSSGVQEGSGIQAMCLGVPFTGNVPLIPTFLLLSRQQWHQRCSGYRARELGEPRGRERPGKHRCHPFCSRGTSWGSLLQAGDSLSILDFPGSFIHFFTF